MSVHIVVDGQAVDASAGVSVAAALLNAGHAHFRTSVGAGPRGPLCGMGICFECRVSIDGAAHVRACMVPVREGMEVRTGG
jgi:D-hydroxyproline dehydrogenase subunit gamma